jgi:hypothetical protein
MCPQVVTIHETERTPDATHGSVSAAMCPGVPFSLLAVSLCTSLTWAVRSCIAVGGYDQVDPMLLVRRVVTVMIVDQNVSFS